MGKVLQMVAKEEIVAPSGVSARSDGKDRTVEITLSMNLLDQADNLRAGSILWEKWGAEEGRTVDTDRFVNEVAGWMREGRGLLIVARVDDEPVGMVSLHFNYDTAKSRVRIMGERLYVVPEHRDMTVFHAIFDAGEMVSILIGAAEEVISCRYGSHLQNAYERRGFVPTDVLLKREV
jgi:hypothetical protein